MPLEDWATAMRDMTKMHKTWRRSLAWFRRYRADRQRDKHTNRHTDRRTDHSRLSLHSPPRALPGRSKNRILASWILNIRMFLCYRHTVRLYEYALVAFPSPRSAINYSQSKIVTSQIWGICTSCHEHDHAYRMDDALTKLDRFIYAYHATGYIYNTKTIQWLYRITTELYQTYYIPTRYISLHCVSEKNAHLFIWLYSFYKCWPIHILFGTQYTKLMCNITVIYLPNSQTNCC